MSIELQKIVGAILFALILTVGAGMIGDIVIPTHAPSESAEEVQVAEPATAQPPGAAGEAQPDQPLPALLAAASAEKGQAVAKKCVACHSFDEGGPAKVGPNLHGVVGADIAAKPGFSYSQALAAKPGEWSYEDLDAFLRKPAEWAPGTKMTFAGLADGQDRADLIAYLRSVSPAAPPLPDAAAQAEGGQPAEVPATEAPATEAPADQPAAPPEQQAAPAAQEPPQAPAAEPQQGAPAPQEQAAAGTTAPAAGGGGGGGLGTLIAQASIEQGQKVAKKCVSCHTFDEGGGNRVGPNLHGIVGADIAAKEYRYSDALTGKEGEWSHENLDQFLADPKGWAPGTKMTFAGIKQAQERAALIAYLRSVSPQAPPL